MTLLLAGLGPSKFGFYGMFVKCFSVNGGLKQLAWLPISLKQNPSPGIVLPNYFDFWFFSLIFVIGDLCSVDKVFLFFISFIFIFRMLTSAVSPYQALFSLILIELGSTEKEAALTKHPS